MGHKTSISSAPLFRIFDPTVANSVSVIDLTRGHFKVMMLNYNYCHYSVQLILTDRGQHV